MGSEDKLTAVTVTVVLGVAAVNVDLVAPTHEQALLYLTEPEHADP